MSNLVYFKISQENPEPSLDGFYIFEKRNPDIKKYIDNTKQIKNYLITIRMLLDKKEKKDVVDKYFRLLANSLNEFSNCSEFSCFINACDNVLGFVKNDLSLLKEIAKRYFKNRIFNEGVPEEWIQAILDSNSARKKGTCGENKLLYFLERAGFKRINTWNDFNKCEKCVVRFSEIFNLDAARKNLDINIKTHKQNKRLDLIIKDKEKIYLLEAKHLNTSGGGQDKQISELIELLSLSEKNKNVSYISFLDGNYSNVLLGEGRVMGKLKTQRRDINKFLKKKPNNYWVNTAGFKKLLENLKTVF
ncbi:MAG: hypothetical protein UV36_C0004G0003 [Parcubacteria group bacterium GW2011_GWC2_42_6]|nr:MAG: hypothetical protein UV36_C0004G0003 [Parcubacteria group bacterium GW2011_GWC2_42_6]KKT76435.1 MAG: hypothetical protein UW72_C0005G0003 [Parcubacteria group bacterium GW2011_GWF2_44_7]